MAAVGAIATPPALAGSGLGEYVNGVQSYDGVFSNFNLPTKYYFQCVGCAQELSDGAAAFYFNRMWYSYNGSSYFNAVGWYKYQSSGTIYRYPAYEIYKPGSDQIYYFTSYPWSTGNTWSAGMWRSNGSTWHFNWWGPNGYNFGYDDSNPAAANSPFEIDVGGYAWNCWNNYNFDVSGALMRNASNGYWYYLPTMAGLYSQGSAPPNWERTSGTAGNNGTLALKSYCN